MAIGCKDIQVTGAVSSVNGKAGAVQITSADIGLGSVTNTSDADKPVSTAQAAADLAVKSEALAAVAACIQSSKIGAASGVASLDATGKLLTAQIPDSILSALKWMGVWDASTNTPELLSTSVEDSGHFYKASVGGTTSGPTGSSVTYVVGDWLISNGTAYQVVPNTLSDATTTTKGVVQLAGDLAGGAAAPLVAKINGITVPASAPTAARKMLMSSSTSALQYDSLAVADLPDATTAAKGIVQLTGDLGGTATAPLVTGINDWAIGNEPTLVNQVLAVTDVSSKTLGYVAQSGDGGVSASYMALTTSASTAVSAGAGIVWTSVMASTGSDISYDSSVITLKAGKTYKLTGFPGGTTEATVVQWRNITTSTLIGSTSGADANANQNTCALAFLTPSVDTQVRLEALAGTMFGVTAYTRYPTALVEVISGSAAVTGQSVDYIEAITASYTAAQGTYCIFSSKVAGNMTLDTSSGYFTLSAGKTYELTASLKGRPTTSYMEYYWKNITAGSALNGSSGIVFADNSAYGESSQPVAHTIFTPTVTTQVAVYLSDVCGGGSTTIDANRSFASIKQLGTSSVIDMIGATSTAAGVKGTVPTPALGYQGAYLRGDGTWDKTSWTSYTPTITGSTTNPTLATTNSLSGRYRISGKNLSLVVSYYAASNSGSANGSGAYKFSLPSGYSIDTSVAAIVSSPTSSGSDFCGFTASPLGSGVIGHSSSAVPCVVVGSSSTTVSLMGTNSTNSGAVNTLIGSGAFAIANTYCYYKFTAEIPIL